MKGAIETIHLLLQTTASQTFSLSPSVPENVVGFKLECNGCSSALTTSGTFYQLSSPSLLSVAGFDDCTGTDMYRMPIVWVQNSTANLNKYCEQLPSNHFYFNNPQRLVSVQFDLTSDGNLSAGPYAILWRLTLYRKPVNTPVPDWEPPVKRQKTCCSDCDMHQ
jgi:hypothetical protein